MSEKLNDLISDLVDISVSWNNMGFKGARDTTLGGVKMLREQERQIKDQETRIQGLVDGLELIKSGLSEKGPRVIAEQALTAYKEGK